ncbi:NAD-P-binding protein [Lentinula aciculospora]|uniref:NAD-P-binding protein n=1 Tax=Lentinula aciculospora TaxID=153920 RepID=A0A9W9DNJ0_9AGAR|nr:NAD-P-binding protein [Lentinula aciculospora]
MTSAPRAPVIRNLAVTERHDVYDAIYPEPYFSHGTLSSFKDKVALVAGASTGIGYTIASFYARAGAKVVIVARYQKTLNEARERMLSEIKESSTETPYSSVEILALAADVTDPEAIEQVVAKVVEKYGHLDVAIANAAIGGSWDQRFPEGDPADWWNVMEVNLRGPYNVAHYTLPHLEATSGAFVGVSSLACQASLPFASAYSVSKSALNRLIEYIAMEYPQVKSFAIHPGRIITQPPKPRTVAAPKWEPAAGDTLQLPAATLLKLTDGSGRFDFLSGRFLSANWDLEEVEREWKKDIVEKDMLLTRIVL